MKWKRTSWDCPCCNYCLWIYTDKKGNVKRIGMAERTVKEAQMNKEEWKKVLDKHNLVGAVIENITKSQDNGRKGILIRTISGKLYHIESKDEKSSLLIYKKIIYTSNTE